MLSDGKYTIPCNHEVYGNVLTIKLNQPEAELKAKLVYLAQIYKHYYELY
jgi:hypothetical protein